MKYLIFVSITLSFLLSFASGTMQISGKVKAMDAQSIELNDGKKIYTLAKAKLSGIQIQSLEKIKIGSEVKLAVPFTAISDVKTIK